MLLVLFVAKGFYCLEVVLRDELNLPRCARGVAKDLTKGTAGQDQVAIGNSKRRSVRNVLSLNTNFEILRLGKPETLAHCHIEIEERWSIKEVPAYIARLTRGRYEELRTLFGSEENVLTVLGRHASEIR